MLSVPLRLPSLAPVPLDGEAIVGRCRLLQSSRELEVCDWLEVRQALLSEQNVGREAPAS